MSRAIGARAAGERSSCGEQGRPTACPSAPTGKAGWLAPDYIERELQ